MTSDALPLRLVEWNVAMALHTKTRLVAALSPDIAILPESAHPDRIGDALAGIGVTSTQWIGASPNKGLLVAAFGEWTLRLDDAFDPGYQWVMPIHMDGPARIRLLAVWDMNHRGSGHASARRLGACRASMDHYAEFLSGAADLTVISGDFNNSVYWDKPGSTVRFGDFMDQLQSRGLVSAYHHRYGVTRGAEPHPTLWWTRNVDKPYHVDYTFVSPAASVGAVTLGSQHDWLTHSDHSPMIVDLRVAPSGQRLAAAADMPPESTPRRGQKPRARTHRERFELAPGELDDLLCGNNGDNFTQHFRPSHFTADWSDGGLVEVRIWGPRVLQNGSTGIRMLDHCWRKSRSGGPIDIDQLPSAVALRLRAFAGENDMQH